MGEYTYLIHTGYRDANKNEIWRYSKIRSCFTGKFGEVVYCEYLGRHYIQWSMLNDLSWLGNCYGNIEVI